MRIKKMLKLAEEIVAKPEEYQQSGWAHKTNCGTTYCIGGRACVIEGYKFRFYEGMLRSFDVILPDGSQLSIGRAAQKALGLTNVQMSKLFNGHAEGCSKRNQKNFEYAVAIGDQKGKAEAAAAEILRLVRLERRRKSK